MNKHIIYFKGTFKGFYQWGEGWTAEKRQLWKTYWQNIKSYHWHYFNDKSCCSDTDYLVGVTGSIYLHPMNFKGGLFDCGVLCNGKYFESEIEDLIGLCENCAKALGGTFEFEVSEEMPIHIDLERVV